jgi:AraC-like DNA-binding protein
VKAFETIQTHYKPVQPLNNASADAVTYNEYTPDERLRSYIYCYWQIKTTSPLSLPFTYRVVADGCIDIFFERDTPTENYVTGFSTTAAEFLLGHSFTYIGIRFLPGIFPAFFNIDASVLTNNVAPLYAIERSLADLISLHFGSRISMTQATSLFDNYFLKIIDTRPAKTDSRFLEALQIITSRQGMLHLEKDLDVAISSRHLRRLFEYYIGGTPKAFSNIVRFQNTLKGILRNNLISRHGYYDQAHFIKAFKTMYGQTPGKALKN